MGPYANDRAHPAQQRRGGGSRSVVFTLWLPKIMIADAVNENHQDRPCHKEKRDRGERIDQYANPEPGISHRKPWN